MPAHQTPARHHKKAAFHGPATDTADAARYSPIGIPAVAAAAAQMRGRATKESQPAEDKQRDVPPVLRQDAKD